MVKCIIEFFKTNHLAYKPIEFLTQIILFDLYNDVSKNNYGTYNLRISHICPNAIRLTVIITVRLDLWLSSLTVRETKGGIGV